MRAVVLGTGPGGLAIAAELSEKGHTVAIADLPQFGTQLEAVGERGGVAVSSNWSGDVLFPVEAASSIEDASANAELVVISVPALAHAVFIETVVPALQREATVLFVGEGGGALAAWPVFVARSRQDVVVAETNCLPYMARVAAPGSVLASRKQGGVLVAAMPATRSGDAYETAQALWPYVEMADSVWETALINYDAIDTVPVAVTSAAKLEGRTGGVLLWGEGATPGVVRLIEAVDAELLALRAALGYSDGRRYRDFLIAQGLAPDVGDLYAVMRAGGITRSYRPSGDLAALTDRLALEVPYALVPAASLGDAIDVDTPTIDGLITISAAMAQRDFWEEGRTLHDLGLGGADRDALVRYAATGSTEESP